MLEQYLFQEPFGMFCLSAKPLSKAQTTTAREMFDLYFHA